MASKIFVVCPNCRARLSFEPFAGYETRMIECPHCHYKAVAADYTPGTNMKPVSSSDDETQLPEFPPTSPGWQSANQDYGQLKIIQSGQICPLKPGINVIGRNASTSTADIKVTNDPYMSRQHVRIDAIDVGLRIEHRLYEINSKNVIKVDGKPINRGDILILNFGTKLTMGLTDFIFEESSEEATKIVM